MTSLNFQTVALIDAMNDRPIAFNRHYVGLGCGINGALMLSQMVYWAKRTKDKDGYFYKTQDEWEQETGLTRWEQETARKKLRGLGFVSEHKHGVPCKVHFKVEHNKLYLALVQYAENQHTSMWDYNKLECGNPSSSDVVKPQTNTEITTKTTTEITADIKAVSKSKFDFAKSLADLGASKQLIFEYMEVRKAKKAVNSETAFKSFITEQQKSGLLINQVLEHCVVNSWKGFKADWLKNQNNYQTQASTRMSEIQELIAQEEQGNATYGF